MSKKSRERSRLNLVRARSWEPELREWCESEGIDLELHNGDQHWTFRGPYGLWAEYWPSNGRFAIDRNYNTAAFVRDWTQIRGRLEHSIQLRTGRLEAELASPIHVPLSVVELTDPPAECESCSNLRMRLARCEAVIHELMACQGGSPAAGMERRRQVANMAANELLSITDERQSSF